MYSFHSYVHCKSSWAVLQPQDGPQICDQSRDNPQNASLFRSASNKKPVRVIRGSTLDSDYAPSEGYRYDGLYVVSQVCTAQR